MNARNILSWALAAVCAVCAAADDAASAVVYTVQDAPGYNSWPMVCPVGGRLVCAYSRGSAHTIGEGARGVFARTSDDGGATWSPETVVADDPACGEVTVGKGRDKGGAMLLWIRCMRGGRPAHELYRTADGVAFARLAAPALSPEPMQITDVLSVPGAGLMSLWFAGAYGQEAGGHAWGVVASADNGRTWTQRVVEEGLDKADWPTEPSAVHLGGGRILAIARCEARPGAQLQLFSADSGKTWSRRRTNIADVRESTPSLLYEAERGLVFNYYYQRGPGLLKCRAARAEAVLADPAAWPGPVTLARGGRNRPFDSGNVNAAALDGRHYVAYYSGDARHASILLLARPGH